MQLIGTFSSWRTVCDCFVNGLQICDATPEGHILVLSKFPHVGVLEIRSYGWFYFDCPYLDTLGDPNPLDVVVYDYTRRRLYELTSQFEILAARKKYETFRPKESTIPEHDFHG